MAIRKEDLNLTNAALKLGAAKSLEKMQDNMIRILVEGDIGGEEIKRVISKALGEKET